LSSPTSRFDDHGDGTVTDRQSKLMWMRCSIGQVWSAGTSTGRPLALSRAAADAEAIGVKYSPKEDSYDVRLVRTAP
jgi:hypothetical protein